MLWYGIHQYCNETYESIDLLLLCRVMSIDDQKNVLQYKLNYNKIFVVLDLITHTWVQLVTANHYSLFSVILHNVTNEVTVDDMDK